MIGQKYLSVFLQFQLIQNMFHNISGEFAALLTAFLWTATALAFESAGKIVGSLAVNIIRLGFATIILAAFNYVTRGLAFPSDATMQSWIYLSLSGLVGFVIGDLCLFQAFVIMGARVSMLIMALAPAFTALIGYVVLGETLTMQSLIAMFITLAGIAMVVLQKSAGSNKSAFKMETTYPVKGLLFALGGAIGQAGGLILSKKGMGDYDAFAATQIRIMAGVVGFFVVIALVGRIHLVRTALKNLMAMKRIAIGSVTGPFLGVSFSLLAIQNTNACSCITHSNCYFY